MRSLMLIFAALALVASPAISQQPAPTPAGYIGLDANLYPGDAALPELHKSFAFIGYWLTNPPGETKNPWVGKRAILRQNGFGFLVVANGRLDKEIQRNAKQGITPVVLAQHDAAAAILNAQFEQFPLHTILFLDQEEGGRLLPEQAQYLLAWTQAVAASPYLPGVYASGQPVPDGNGPDGKPRTVTTIQDIRARIAAGHLHEVAFWAAQDACPPANGCSLQPPPIASSGTPNLTAWQYAQSPRRKAITLACSQTYAKDGNCYPPSLPHFPIDLSVSPTADPSHGR